MNQPRAADRKNLFIEQPAALALMEAPITKQHRYIDIRAQHPLAALTGHQAHVDLWIRFVKPLQPWHEPKCSKGEVGGDLQHFPLAAPTGQGNAVIHRLQTLMHLLEKQLARLGQLDATVDPIEQACAQPRFQALYLLAHRRLRSAQFQRRCGKATQARRGLENAQGIQRQLGKVLKHKLG